MFTLFGYQITIFQIFATVFGVGILVFIHELGHFIMAKKFKLRVEKFTFGFGPELVGFTKGETRYSICAIPLGGMVKLPGEDPESSTGHADEFMSQPWYVRLLIAVFGPLMNYLLAIVLFSFVVFNWGISKPSNLPVIGEAIEGKPAYEAGLKKDDKILKINNKEVSSWKDMAVIIHNSADKELAISIQRGEKKFVVNVTPKKDEAAGVGLIGIMPSLDSEKVGLLESIDYGFKMPFYQSYFTLKYLGTKLVRFEKPDVAGPIGVVQILAKAAKAGWQNLLYLLAVISTALGLFNLLPIPLVDGGHITIALIEATIRKRLNVKAIQVANMVGFGIIISIFLLATYNDILRIF